MVRKVLGLDIMEQNILNHCVVLCNEIAIPKHPNNDVKNTDVLNDVENTDVLSKQYQIKRLKHMCAQIQILRSRYTLSLNEEIGKYVTLLNSSIITISSEGELAMDENKDTQGMIYKQYHKVMKYEMAWLDDKELITSSHDLFRGLMAILYCPEKN